MDTKLGWEVGIDKYTLLMEVSRLVESNSVRPHGTVHGILQARILEWVESPDSPFSSSQPRDQTQVFCIAGGFSTS